MWADFQKHSRMPLVDQRFDRVGEEHRLSQVLPPVLGIKFGSVDNPARHRGIKRHRRRTGLDVREDVD